MRSTGQKYSKATPIPKKLFANSRMAGLYLHIPFCKQACYYCDFHFSTDIHHRTEMVKAMVDELRLRKDYTREPMLTLYFGGGTPSLLTDDELSELLEAVRENYSLDPEAEITLEANPDDLTAERLLGLRRAGVNRLSIGVQSFDPGLLKFLHRSHGADRARQCLNDARDAGFTNISIDLIYAIPGLTDALWDQTLKEAVNFSPEHISLYALTIEERTVFGNWKKRGKLIPAQEEMAARQFERLMELLAAAGYEHYEISNFSKPGYPSQHNSSYWEGTPYVGIGPSAHSYDGASRQFNARNNAQYTRAVQSGVIPAEREVLTRSNQINEYLLTSLRTSRGCDFDVILRRWNEPLMATRQEYITRLIDRQLVVLEGSVLRLTRTGRLLADQLIEDLMVED
jgi:oxygen-independent coproporphyrinogen-3 oxidase